MKSLWKVVLPLALGLSLVAYAAGALTAVDNSSEPRETIVIQDTGQQDSSKDEKRRGGKKDDDDDQETRRESDDDDSDDEIDVVEPEPEDVTAEADERAGRDAGDDDISGAGTNDQTLDHSRDD